MYYLGHEQKRTNVKEDNSEKLIKIALRTLELVTKMNLLK